MYNFKAPRRLAQFCVLCIPLPLYTSDSSFAWLCCAL